MATTRVSHDGREIAALVEALPCGRFVPCRFVLGLSGAPGAGRPRWRSPWPRRTACRWCRWTASTAPTPSSWPWTDCEAKGAPDTFDAEGYAALLRRLQAGGTVLAPAFDHGQPDPIPDAIEIPAEAGLVVTEGNYLLLDEPRWHAVRRECDAVWHVVTDEDTRIERLVQRHALRQAAGAGAGLGAARRPAQRRPGRGGRAVPDAADEVLDLTEWAGAIAVRSPRAD